MNSWDLNQLHGYKMFILPEDMRGELSVCPLTSSLFITDIGYFPHANNHIRERKEGCNSHILIYCVQGEGWVELDNRTESMSRHQMIVIPENAPHRYGASNHDPWSIYWCHLQGTGVTELLRLYNLDSGVLRLPYAACTEVAERFDQCFSLLENMPLLLNIQLHISQTISHMLGSIGLQLKGSRRDKQRAQDLERTIHFMNQNLTASLRLSELAACTGISKQHLISLFNQETNCPPIEYFLRLKMQKAGQLLSLTALSVKEVAFALGISDPYYFSRLFKKMMGVSPAAYRSVRKG